MALSKIAKRRLTTLIRFMSSLPRSANRHFDMESWFSHSGDHEIKGAITQRIMRDCGTTACALGWACTIPSFRKAGLHLEVGFRAPMYGGVIGLSSATRFFEITGLQSLDLFDGTIEDKTPKQWAKRARGLLKQWAQ